MEWGPQLQWLQEIAKDTGVLPPALAARPSLQPHLDFYLSAFRTLSRSRGRTMGGLVPIEFGEITRWLDEYEVWDRDQRDRVISHIQDLDSTYITVIEEKTNKKATELNKDKRPVGK